MAKDDIADSLAGIANAIGYVGGGTKEAPGGIDLLSLTLKESAENIAGALDGVAAAIVQLAGAVENLSDTK